MELLVWLMKQWGVSLLLCVESSSKLIKAVRSGEMEYPPFLVAVTILFGRFLQKNIRPKDLSMILVILDFLELAPIFIGSIDTKLLFILFDWNFHIAGLTFKNSITRKYVS